MDRVKVKSTFREEIKAKQFEDRNLNKVVSDEASKATLYLYGLFLFRGRCVPRVSDLIHNMLVKVHGLQYSTHPGETKMYYHLRQLFGRLG